MIKVIKFEQSYNYFERGTKVRPTSTRCPLREGVYTVVSCTEPLYPGDEAVCFLEGRECGIMTEYLTEAE